MILKIYKLIFNSLELAQRDIPKIRGNIASKYPEYDELHNHRGDKFIYRYPLIQYKTIESKPAIIGINEGAEILLKIENNIESLKIGNDSVEIYEKEINISMQPYGLSDSLIKYKFLSPWMCLNEKNYSLYNSFGENEKDMMLKRILIGNILSMSKGVNYNVDGEVKAYINLRSCKINFKNQEMMGFKGEFLTNFNIPDFMGIGKSVSRGFGQIKRADKLTFK